MRRYPIPYSISKFYLEILQDGVVIDGIVDETASALVKDLVELRILPERLEITQRSSDVLLLCFDESVVIISFIEGFLWASETVSLLRNKVIQTLSPKTNLLIHRTERSLLSRCNTYLGLDNSTV